jgi:hypothetical protein
LARLRYIAVTFILWLLPFSLLQAQSCDNALWKHVYHPTRLNVKQLCTSVTGVIVDATATEKEKQKDGQRHEADGDGHGWLKPDPGQENVLIAGNIETQQGNLVFEIICRYRVTQADAKTACRKFKSSVVLPPVGSHVRITGSLIEDLDHKPIHREIHPVTSIEVLP